MSGSFLQKGKQIYSTDLRRGFWGRFLATQRLEKVRLCLDLRADLTHLKRQRKLVFWKKLVCEGNEERDLVTDSFLHSRQQTRFRFLTGKVELSVAQVRYCSICLYIQQVGISKVLVYPIEIPTHREYLHDSLCLRMSWEFWLFWWFLD